MRSHSGYKGDRTLFCMVWKRDRKQLIFKIKVIEASAFYQDSILFEGLLRFLTGFFDKSL
ncbi:hypothetical protein Cal6303_3285 [Calothrix sp. PCC 6303]|nr:hypothetical protein Cal6303_3285 [Calothrix sp. PCC 6303]